MAKELTDQEMNEHMDDYEEVSISSKDNEVWPTMELKLTVTVVTRRDPGTHLKAR